MAKATSVKIDNPSGGNILFASWVWTKTHTTGYKVTWKYKLINGVEYTKNDEVTVKSATFTMPDDAVWVKVRVKPYTTEKHKVKGKSVVYWTASWSSYKTFKNSEYVPITPPAPSASIIERIENEAEEKYELSYRVDGVNWRPSGDSGDTKVEFEVYVDDETDYWKRFGEPTQCLLVAGSATGSVYVSVGHQYKVRCRLIQMYKTVSIEGDWSEEYSAVCPTPPLPYDGPLTCSAKTKTSVLLKWEHVKNAAFYTIEYTTKEEYFDSPGNPTSVTDSITTNYYEITGLEPGETYYFRLSVTNDSGTSGWSETKVSIILGIKPIAPTTWSSTTTAVVGEPLKLYWIHNSIDGSSQTYAELELTVDGETTVQTIKNELIDDEDRADETSVYSFDTNSVPVGAKLLWRVRTRGVLDRGIKEDDDPNGYGDWSTQRAVDIYAKPVLALGFDDSNGNVVDVLSRFPVYIIGSTTPSTQNPIGYYVAIVANEDYETINDFGDPIFIPEGTEVFSRNLDISEQLRIELTPSDVNLINNVSYTLVASASMDSGLTTDEEEIDFTVGFEDSAFEIDGEVVVDYDSLVSYIRPYCEDETLNEQTLFSVYRLEFDGSYTEISKNRSSDEWVVDPHPSLDYARYRVVAKSKVNGVIEFDDLPNYPVQEKAAIIQWDEVWKNFMVYEEDEDTDERPWTGSMLRLPFNLDVSDSYAQDVKLIEYIGREHPVSYYGTQVGSASTWNVDIDREDVETLYQLRRLARWMGDVYVREPSGSGYWANVTVAFSQRHTELVIPVTLHITRVEGGV